MQIFKWLFLTMFMTLISCQTTGEKNQALIKDRVDKLKPLTSMKPTWCRLETHLTQPALARYQQMFPDESEKLGAESWNYTWKARKTACEIIALDSSLAAKNLQGFLDSALCMLLQVHWVNSPFEDLNVGPTDIVEADERVQIRAGNSPELGIFLDPEVFNVETKTKSRGLLRATYSLQDGEWLPERLEQRLPKSLLVVDKIEYDKTRVGSRRMIQSLWISVGEDRALAYTQVFFRDCRPY